MARLERGRWIRARLGHLVINFRWLKHAVDGLGGKRASTRLAWLAGFRYLLLGGAAYVILIVFFHQPGSHARGFIRVDNSRNRRNLLRSGVWNLNSGSPSCSTITWPVWATHYWELWRASRSAAVGQLRRHAVSGGPAPHGGGRSGPVAAVGRPARANLQQAFELLLRVLVERPGGRSNRAQRPYGYLGYFGTIFLFILTANLIGLVPCFESPTQNPSVTAGCALTTFIYYNLVGIQALGFKYPLTFAGPVWWLAPLMLPIEIISHMARCLSLTVRLYANMFAGEQVTHGVHAA